MRSADSFIVSSLLVIFGTTQAVNVTAMSDAVKPAIDINVVIDQPAPDRFPRVFGYSGNIWRVPQVFEFGVSDMILEMPRLGIARIGLGDEILSHASSMSDLEQRLENFRLNDFLRRYSEAGGKVMIILDTVPFWNSSRQTRERHGHLEIFRLSPPHDYEEWGRVVATIVQHFNGRLGLDAYYEVWNEPDVDFLGTNSEYSKLYYHAVVGVKKTDRNAKVGGAGASDFLAIKTYGETQPAYALQAPMIVEWMLDFASRTPVPELGLPRLPVDFISWHAYYRDPITDYKVILPFLRNLLKSKGYPRSTPLFNTEWNIAAVPPYPEGDLNASEVGAAYVASALIAMHDAGVGGQVFQMFVDPGVNDYSGGTFTTAGVPRANFNTFKLFSELKGKRVKSTTSDDWVKSVAYSDDQNVYLLVTSLLPTTKMMQNGLALRRRIGALKTLRETFPPVTTHDIAEFLQGNRTLPEPLHSEMSAIMQRDMAAMSHHDEKALSWKSGISLNISLTDLRSHHSEIIRYIIDSNFSNGRGDVTQAITQVIEKNQIVIANARARLQILGVSESVQNEFFNDIRINGNILQTLDHVSEGLRNSLKSVFRQISVEYRANLEQVMDREGAKLHKETLPWPTSGILTVDSQPYSVQLFVIKK